MCNAGALHYRSASGWEDGYLSPGNSGWNQSQYVATQMAGGHRFIDDLKQKTIAYEDEIAEYHVYYSIICVFGGSI